MPFCSSVNARRLESKSAVDWVGVDGGYSDWGTDELGSSGAALLTDPGGKAEAVEETAALPLEVIGTVKRSKSSAGIPAQSPQKQPKEFIVSYIYNTNIN